MADNDYLVSICPNLATLMTVVEASLSNHPQQHTPTFESVAQSNMGLHISIYILIYIQFFLLLLELAILSNVLPIMFGVKALTLGHRHIYVGILENLRTAHNSIV